MAYSQPNEAEATLDTQAYAFGEEIEELAYSTGMFPTKSVLDGCLVSPNADLQISVATGVVWYDGKPYVVAAATPTATAADGTNTRIDYVAYDVGSTAVDIVAGTAAESPQPPTLDTDHVLLAELTIPASLTEITSDHIVDKRVLGHVPPSRHVLHVDVTNGVDPGTNTWAGWGRLPELAFDSIQDAVAAAGANYTIYMTGMETLTSVVDITSAKRGLSIVGTTRAGWGSDVAGFIAGSGTFTNDTYFYVQASDVEFKNLRFDDGDTNTKYSIYTKNYAADTRINGCWFAGYTNRIGVSVWEARVDDCYWSSMHTTTNETHSPSGITQPYAGITFRHYGSRISNSVFAGSAAPCIGVSMWGDGIDIYGSWIPRGGRNSVENCFMSGATIMVASDNNIIVGCNWRNADPAIRLDTQQSSDKGKKTMNLLVSGCGSVHDRRFIQGGANFDYVSVSGCHVDFYDELNALDLSGDYALVEGCVFKAGDDSSSAYGISLDGKNAVFTGNYIEWSSTSDNFRGTMVNVANGEITNNTIVLRGDRDLTGDNFNVMRSSNIKDNTVIYESLRTDGSDENVFSQSWEDHQKPWVVTGNRIIDNTTTQNSGIGPILNLPSSHTRWGTIKDNTLLLPNVHASSSAPVWSNNVGSSFIWKDNFTVDSNEDYTRAYPDGTNGMEHGFVKVVNAAYTMTLIDQYVAMDGTASSFTVTLPDAAENDGMIVQIALYGGTTNTYTVSRAGTDNIDNAGSSKTSFTLDTEGAFVQLYSVKSATDWVVLDTHGTITWT